jgi:hypothetical protein
MELTEKQAGKKRLTHEDIFRLHAVIAGEVMDQGEAGRYQTMRERMGQLSITAARELGELIAAKKIGSQGVKRGTVYLWTK